MNFETKRCRIFKSFTVDVDPGYQYIGKSRGGVKWYMMQSKVFVSSISFKLKNENVGLASFNGLSITFRLSMKDV